MVKEKGFIKEPAYWEARSLAGKEWEEAAKEIETEMNGIDINQLKEQREELLEADDLDGAVKIDEEINRLSALQKEAKLLREFGEQEAAKKSDEILAERKKRFQDVMEKLSSGKMPKMHAMLSAHKSEIIPHITDDGVAERLLRLAKKYQSLDNKTSVDPENIERYLHEETIGQLLNDDRETVNAARYGELIKAILSTDAPDLRDLDFAEEIIEGTKNKFLRNLALKKTVEIISALPELQRKVKVGDRELSPGLTRIYEFTGSNLPKSEFLFTVPFSVKNGLIQEQLLSAVERYYRENKIRAGSGKGKLYFTAVVDLYDSNHPADLTPVIEVLAREQRFNDSEYSRQLQEKNAKRVSQGKKPLDRILKLSHLRQAYQDMKLRVLEQHSPDDYAEIKQLQKEEQPEFINALFKDIWQKLSREEKREFWDEELSEIITRLAQSDLSRTNKFEEILKKLSAIRLHDQKSFKRLLSDTKSNLHELNGAADKEQLLLFFKIFEFTEADRKILTDISNLPPDAKLLNVSVSQINNLYRSFGNFNAPLILMDRYRQGSYSKLKPEILRKNLMPLLKEAIYHIAVGDFKDWRAGMTHSIQGNKLEYRENDYELWDLWHRDDASHSFQTPLSVNLIGGLKAESPFNRYIVKNPRNYLLNPDLWTDDKSKQILKNLKDLNHEEFIQRLEEIKKAINDRDPEILGNYGISPKDQAALGKLNNIIRGIEATEELCLFLENAGKTADARYAELEPLLKAVNLSTMMDAQKFASNQSKRQAAAGYRFLEKLKQFLSRIRTIEEKRNHGQISVTDSSDPYDLLTVGQQSHTIINCMSYEGDPNRNAYILDIATSKNKKVIKVKENERTVARAVLKLLRDQEDQNAKPIVIVDDLIVEPGQQIYTYYNEIIEHIKRKFTGRPDIIIGRGIHDTDKELQEMRKLQSENDPAEEKQKKIKEFNQKNILLAWSTGSRVSAELVETAASGAKPQPRMQHEPKKPGSGKKLTTAFYSHFVQKE